MSQSDIGASIRARSPYRPTLRLPGDARVAVWTMVNVEWHAPFDSAGSGRGSPACKRPQLNISGPKDAGPTIGQISTIAGDILQPYRRSSSANQRQCSSRWFTYTGVVGGAHLTVHKSNRLMTPPLLKPSCSHIY
jgi:hypothetical protein